MERMQTEVDKRAAGRPSGLEAANTSGWSARTAGLVAGLGLLLMAPLAGLGYGVAVLGLVTPGDAAATATDILAAEGLFRAGIVSLLLVIVLDVVVAWALYRVLLPVSQALSSLAAAFRLVYAAVFAAAVGQLVGVVPLLRGDDHLAAFGQEQLQAQALLRIDAFAEVWGAGLALFGVHLLLVGYLTYRSKAMPKLLGVFVAVAGLGYVFDSLADLLAGGGAPTVAAFTFAGEVLLALWLVIRSRQLV